MHWVGAIALWIVFAPLFLIGSQLQGLGQQSPPAAGKPAKATRGINLPPGYVLERKDEARKAVKATGEPAFLQPPEIARILKESFVAIETRDQTGRRIATGSGFYIKPDMVLTNLHVLKWAYSAEIKSIIDGVRVTATGVLFPVDRRHDLAVLATSHPGIPVKRAARLPDVGDRVYVLGNPMGREATFSSGMVNALRSGAVQIDAPISPGSSGGPVADGRGQVFGLSTSYMSNGQNLNFAVPLAFLDRSDEETRLQLAVSSAGAAALTDVEYNHLFGRVKSVTTKRGDYYVDNVKGPERIVRVEKYNEDGYLLESCAYDPAMVEVCTAYQRDDDTLVSQIIDRHNGAPGEPLILTEGQALDSEIRSRPFSTEFSRDSEGKHYSFRADENGNVVEHKVNDIVTSRSRYDDGGREIEYVALEGLGSVRSRTRSSYTLDEKGNWTSREEETLLEYRPSVGWLPAGYETREIRYW